MIINSNLIGQNISDQLIAKLIDKARAKFHVPAIGVNVMSADAIYITEASGTKVAGMDLPLKKEDYFHTFFKDKTSKI